MQDAWKKFAHSLNDNRNSRELQFLFQFLYLFCKFLLDGIFNVIVTNHDESVSAVEHEKRLNRCIQNHLFHLHVSLKLNSDTP